MVRLRLSLALVVAVIGSVAIAMAVWRADSGATTLGSLTAGAEMLAPRSGHTATLLPDGRVLIAGGMRHNGEFYRTAELYDPSTGKFQRSGDMTTARVGHAAVLLRSGKVLIAGGWVGSGTTESAELYDPKTGKFTPISRMTTKRARPSITLLPNGNALIAGGADRDGPGGRLESAEIFQAATLSFQPTGSMHHARISHTASLLKEGRVLIVGGRGENVTSSAELYDPKTGRFSETGSLITARYKHTAGLLPDGRVLIAGGSDERDWGGTMNSAEIYDVRTERFVSASSMNNKRFKLPDEAVMLRSGQLLIAGGSRQAEVFDPRIGKFLVVSGEMTDARHFMSETMLNDGSVLLAGGYYNNDESTSHTWLYHP